MKVLHWCSRAARGLRILIESLFSVHSQRDARAALSRAGPPNHLATPRSGAPKLPTAIVRRARPGAVAAAGHGTAQLSSASAPRRRPWLSPQPAKPLGDTCAHTRRSRPAPSRGGGGRTPWHGSASAPRRRPHSRSRLPNYLALAASLTRRSRGARSRAGRARGSGRRPRHGSAQRLLAAARARASAGQTTWRLAHARRSRPPRCALGGTALSLRAPPLPSLSPPGPPNLPGGGRASAAAVRPRRGSART
jgi:hypothetical protein